MIYVCIYNLNFVCYLKCIRYLRVRHNFFGIDISKYLHVNNVN